MTKPNLVNYGQHFLINPVIVRLFLSYCKLSGKEQVLEIGPGSGVITRELVKNAKMVTAVEIDETLRSTLAPLENRFPQLKVHYQNALQWAAFDYDLICGALSYAIFEPLMVKLFSQLEFKRGVFLVSAQVEEGFAKKTGRLFYLLSNFFEASFSEVIAPTNFLPAPRTAGVIITLKRRENPNLQTQIWQEVWLQGDKKIKNSLKEALIRVAAKNGQTLTQKEAKLKVAKIAKMRESELSLWQAGNDFLHIINQFIVYSKVC
jgi:16S rRNA A1518/A1519 N6-dimethyltransferase RsmA/KsgA/DIM1 with predicted DNA glycosylase/AP lyase activity